VPIVVSFYIYICTCINNTWMKVFKSSPYHCKNVIVQYLSEKSLHTL
jgi:hypothetical protein